MDKDKIDNYIEQFDSYLRQEIAWIFSELPLIEDDYYGMPIEELRQAFVDGIRRHLERKG